MLGKNPAAQNLDWRLWELGCAAEEKGKIAEAVRLYRRSAKLGFAEAQINLGNLLDDYTKPRRPAEAVYWYKRAIKQGYACAADNLAIHYRNLGKPRWHMHWLKVAAKMGDPDAPKAVRALQRELEGHIRKR